MNLKKLGFLTFCFFIFSIAVLTDELNLTRPTRRLLPLPQKMETLDEDYFFFDSFNLIVLPFTDHSGLKMFLEEFGPFNLDANANKQFVIGTVNDIKTIPQYQEILDQVPTNEEGYYLEVTTDNIILIGRNEVGTFWGLQTLAQLIDDLGGVKVAFGAKIIDYPLLKYRGFQDDISRGPITTLAYMKQIVKIMSELKLNVFSPYMELHVLEGVGKPGATFTVAELKELVEYAKDFHVDIIPSIQTFGHNNVFLEMPEFNKFSNSPGAFSVQLDPTNPKVYEFLDEIIAKYAAVTTSDFIHINCDEAWELPYGKSGAWAKEIGGISEVYLQHLIKVIDIVKNHGKTAMFWGDMALNHQEIIKRIPNDAVVVNWHYMDSASIPSRLKPFQDAGLRQWGAPGISNWMNLFPAYSHSFYNIKDYALQGVAHGTEGILVTSWDDDGETLFGPNWFGVAIAGESAWRGGKTDLGGLKRRFSKALLGLDSSKIGDAIQLLADTNIYSYIKYEKAGNVLFNLDPFTDLDHYSKRSGGLALKEVEAKVLEILSENKPGKNAFLLETLPFIAHKSGVLGHKLAMTEKVIKLVNEAANTNNPELLWQAKAEIDAYIPMIEMVKEEFTRLWKLENKDFFLDVVLRRYTNQVNILQQRSKDLAKFATNKTVPDVKTMGFPKVGR